jgi:nitroimidazol reductase NimA-like FMN-containing flavoprotein (pyridoxamine 5'-phosphate oxidase superfamily)
MEERGIRRKDRILSEEATLALLAEGEVGILATADSENWPYATPLSYVYKDGLIYFHSALSGHKTDNLACNNKVSFVVVGKTKPVYDGSFTTLYSSVVVFGLARVVSEHEEKKSALYALAAKYLPDCLDRFEDSIARYFKRTAVYAVRPERITGKANSNAG